MKDQIYNQGELKELKVMIEKDTLESFERMAHATNTPIADLVVVALKRYRSSHTDYDPANKPAKK